MTTQRRWGRVPPGRPPEGTPWTGNVAFEEGYNLAMNSPEVRALYKAAMAALVVMPMGQPETRRLMEAIAAYEEGLR